MADQAETEQKLPLAEVDKEAAASHYDSVARRRLIKELMSIQKDAPPGISAAPQADDLMSWGAIIVGPRHTPWDEGIFKLELKFTEEYPHTPPVVRFDSTMFHPNIYADGHIDLDILRDQWNPIYDVTVILLSIQALLLDPDVNNPANDEAAEMLINHKEVYNIRVRETVELSWID